MSNNFSSGSHCGMEDAISIRLGLSVGQYLEFNLVSAESLDKTAHDSQKLFEVGQEKYSFWVRVAASHV